MWRLHRYYLKELTIHVAITFLVLFAVVLVSLVYRGIQRAQGGELLDAALITLLFALDALPHLLTISFLIATVMTFTRAAQDRELTAIRAAGIPPRAPLLAALLVGLLLAGVGSVAMHYVVPEVHFRKYRVIADVARNLIINLGLGSDRIRLPKSSVVVTYKERQGPDLLGCVVYGLKLGHLVSSPIVFVDRLSIPIPSAEDTRADTVLSVQLRGIQDPLGGGQKHDLEIEVPLGDLAGRERRDERDDDLRSDQLLGEVLRGVHPRPFEAVYTLFRRCCFALMPVVLAPIGFCLAEFARDRGRVAALVLALVPLALFYLGEVLGARLLLSTQSPWCGWLPMALLALFGVPLCWRQLRR
jgi:lipopolysaccharide export LptBFGC system permease protein LptF